MFVVTFVLGGFIAMAAAWLAAGIFEKSKIFHPELVPIFAGAVWFFVLVLAMAAAFWIDGRFLACSGATYGGIG